LFSSELRQISINFDNFWQKDGQDDEIMPKIIKVNGNLTKTILTVF